MLATNLGFCTAAAVSPIKPPRIKRAQSGRYVPLDVEMLPQSVLRCSREVSRLLRTVEQFDHGLRKLSSTRGHPGVLVRDEA
jgi:hypothetical protein